MNKEEAYQELKKRIINEELFPGEWLVERGVSAEFNISRTPVREIFRRLASDGFLELQPTKGYLVRKLNLEEIVEIFQAREAAEGTAARLCCLRGDENFFSRIEQLRDRLEKIDVEKDTSLGVIIGRELHDTIVDLSLIHISEPTRRYAISYAVFCLKKKKRASSVCASTSALPVAC